MIVKLLRMASVFLSSFLYANAGQTIKLFSNPAALMS